MRTLRAFWRGLATLLRPTRDDRDLRDEVAQYIEASVAERIRGGESPERARRAAQLAFGNRTGVREQTRTARWEHAIETTIHDVRYAVRGLRRAPVFAMAATTTLAIGIGASTAVFSATAPILFEPLPFPRASQLVIVSDRSQDGHASPPTLGTYEELRVRAHGYEALAAGDGWRPSLTDAGDPERIDGQRVTAGYFGMFGTAPVLGRGFRDDDDVTGGPRVAIIANALWQRRFGGDRAVIGRTVQLDGDPWLIIGVMPPGFANVLAPKAQIWAPMQLRVGGNFDSEGWGHHYQIVGRLRAGMTPLAATREMQQIGSAPVAAFPRPPWASMSQGLLVASLQERIAGPVRPALLAIIGAVLLLLLIASVNVTNLLLARGTRRRPELAMRIALGSTRGRLVRQLVTESVVLSLVAGIAGLLLARIGLSALIAAAPATLPRADAMHLDVAAFGFALLLTALVGVVVGLVPALRALRADVADGLRPGTTRSTGGPGSARAALVVIEVALALMLLVGGGLLYRSVQRLVSVPPGFDASHVVTIQAIAAGNAFRSDSARLLFYQQALAAAQQVPGVEHAAWTSQLPLSGDVDGYGIQWETVPATAKGAGGSAMRYAVTPDYFSAMRIPLIRGRLLNSGDRAGGTESIVINAALARRLFANSDPIGQRVHFGPEMGDTARWDVVVGVVGDVKHYGLAVPAPDAFYVSQPQWQWVDESMSLVVRAKGDPRTLITELKRAVWSVNPAVPIQRTVTMDALVTASAGQRLFVLLAMEVFAITALVLAGVGLYGVISGSVTERMREFGIRTALGAAPAALVASVVRRALLLTIAGTAVGAIGAVFASRMVASMLYGVTRSDPVSYAVGIGVLAAVAVIAAWAPARRAARVDPTVALRAE